SDWTKLAKRAIDDGRFNNQQISELASAVGTLEYKAGRRKDGKKHLSLSLLEPSENAIAQAGWVARTLSNDVQVPQKKMEISAEAAAWAAFEISDWNVALERSQEWQDDQPFSSRPAVQGSFIAATIFDNFEQAKTIALRGMRCN